MEFANETHHTEGGHAHLSQCVEPSRTIVHASKRLNGVSNFSIGRKICRLDPPLAQSARRFLLYAGGSMACTMTISIANLILNEKAK